MVQFSERATHELSTLTAAVGEVLDLAKGCFERNDLDTASKVEPLEQVIDHLKEEMRARHIVRLQEGKCTISAGFVLADLLTCLERTSDHCSNIAGCIIDTAHNNLNIHESLRAAKSGNDENFEKHFHDFSEKYAI